MVVTVKRAGYNIAALIVTLAQAKMIFTLVPCTWQCDP